MSAGIGDRDSGIGSRESRVEHGATVGAAPRAALTPPAFGGRSGRHGQTTTEYLMVAGIMTAIGLMVLLWFFQPWRQTVRDVADCVRTDDCEAAGAE